MKKIVSSIALFVVCTITPSAARTSDDGELPTLGKALQFFACSQVYVNSIGKAPSPAFFALLEENILPPNYVKHCNQVMRQCISNNTFFQSIALRTPSFLDEIGNPLATLGKAIQDIGFMAMATDRASRALGYNILIDKASLMAATAKIRECAIHIMSIIGPEYAIARRFDAGMRQILEIDPPLLELY